MKTIKVIFRVKSKEIFKGEIQGNLHECQHHLCKKADLLLNAHKLTLYVINHIHKLTLYVINHIHKLTLYVINHIHAYKISQDNYKTC